jgi:hypothetical protein
MSFHTSANVLRTVLLIDAVTCVAMGLLMSTGAEFLAQKTHLPYDLLFIAGLILFPVAVFMTFVAMRPNVWSLGVWLVILGNCGWVAASVWLLAGDLIHPNLGGYLFLAVQAAAVIVLSAIEYAGIQNRAATA